MRPSTLAQNLREKASILNFVFYGTAPVIILLAVAGASPQFVFGAAFIFTILGALVWTGVRALAKKIAELPMEAKAPARNEDSSIVYVPMDIPVPAIVYRIAVRQARDEDQIPLELPPSPLPTRDRDRDRAERRADDGLRRDAAHGAEGRTPRALTEHSEYCSERAR
jgi:hypothetical protein